MQVGNRSIVIIAIIMIALGGILLASTLIPGFNAWLSWTVVFFILAIFFFLPALIWRRQRRGLAGLFIPGSILLMLGFIFTYNTITRDWASWAYCWLLIPVAVGFGLLLAAWAGSWGRGAAIGGLWVIVVNTALFSLFATLFGLPSLRIAGSGLLIFSGLAMLLLILFNRRE